MERYDFEGTLGEFLFILIVMYCNNYFTGHLPKLEVSSPEIFVDTWLEGVRPLKGLWIDFTDGEFYNIVHYHLFYASYNIEIVVGGLPGPAYVHQAFSPCLVQYLELLVVWDKK